MAVGPTTRRRQLGADLRRLREHKGLTWKRRAHSWASKATLSRYARPRKDQSSGLLSTHCAVSTARPTKNASNCQVAKGAKIQGWWRSLADPIPESMNLMLTLEERGRA